MSVSPQVAEELLRSGRDTLSELGEELGREIEVRARPGLHREQYEVTALDAGEPVSISLGWISESPEEAVPELQADAGEDDSASGADGEGEAPAASGDGPDAEDSGETPEGTASFETAAGGDSPGPEAGDTSAPEVSGEEPGNPAEAPAQTLDFAGESRILPPSEGDGDR